MRCLFLCIFGTNYEKNATYKGGIKLRTIIALIVSLTLSYIIYRIYMNISDWKFTLAFLGGAITLIIVQLIINRKGLSSD